MSNTGQRNPQVLAEYARRRKNQMVVTIPLFAILIGFYLGQNREAGTIMGLPAQFVAPVFIVVVLGALVVSFLNWRCPACKKYLGRTFNPKHCHSCSAALHE